MAACSFTQFYMDLKCSQVCSDTAVLQTHNDVFKSVKQLKQIKFEMCKNLQKSIAEEMKA